MADAGGMGPGRADGEHLLYLIRAVPPKADLEEGVVKLAKLHQAGG